MIFRSRLKFHLVKLLKCSNKQAELYCKNGLIEVDKITELDPLILIEDHQEICYKTEIIRKGTELLYVLFYKPNLYECTANRDIENNIYQIIPSEFQHLFPLGRLDKNSEGLLLLTNDGSVYSNMVDAGGEIDKEYIVTTCLPITHQLEKSFVNSFELGSRMTLPARFEIISEYEFKVILNEGINRQIRRICAKNDNQVKTLTRTRFGKHYLGNLPIGECKKVAKFI